MALIAIIRDTLRQAISQVVWIVMFGLAVLMPLLVLAAISIDDSGNTMLFGQPIGYLKSSASVAALIRTNMTGFLYGVYAILFIFTASFVATRNLRKGVAEMYLSKPISRTTILLGKFVGIFLVYYLPAIVMIIGIHVIVNARMGVNGITWLPALMFAGVAGILLTSLSLGYNFLSNGPVLGLLVLTAMWIVTPIAIDVLVLLGDKPVFDGDGGNYAVGEQVDENDGSFGAFCYKSVRFMRRYVMMPLSDIDDFAKAAEVPHSTVTTKRPLYVAAFQTLLALVVAYISFIRRDY